MSAFADPADMTDRFDAQTIADLLSDDGVPVANLSGNSKLAVLLADASGAVLAACAGAKLYAEDDLLALTGNSRALLKRIVCDLTMGFLIQRRPEKYGQEAVASARESAELYLDRLRKGDRVFDRAANVEAGLPTTDGPTSIDLQRLNLITARTKNYFPHYSRRLPIGRSVGHEGR